MSTDALDVPADTAEPCTNPSAPAPASEPFPEPTTAELDVLGFSRQGPEATPLDALWRLLNGFTEHDTPESEAAHRAIEKFNRKCKPKDRVPLIRGIAEGSQAWHDAHTAGITLHRIPAPPPPPWLCPGLVDT